jgi:hypothetical protein
VIAMRNQKKRIAEDAPTKPRDWVAAVEIRPGAPSLRKGIPVTFFVYAASSDPTLFAALAEDDRTLLPACPKKGRWILFKSFSEAGRPRIGFDETSAKRSIKIKGYHLFRVKLDTSEITTRKSA